MKRDDTDRIIEQAISRKGEQEALGALGRIGSADQLRQMMQKAERKRSPAGISRLIWPFASAAAVIAVVLLVGLQPRYSDKELYARWSEKVVYERTFSRGEDTAQEQFEAALAQARGSNPAASVAALEAIAADAASEYAEDARWYLAMVYLQTGERSRAAEILARIAQTTSPYSAEAAELLTELNRKRWF